jgi:hypothetical protein
LGELSPIAVAALLLLQRRVKRARQWVGSQTLDQARRSRTSARFRRAVLFGVARERFRGTLAGQEGSSLSAICRCHVEERTMISKVVSAAAIAVLIFAAAPASAMKMASCNQKNMDKTDAMLMKMPDGENKTDGMQEMTSAKSSMSQKDMAGCKDHMNKAMKMGMMKSKKM